MEVGWWDRKTPPTAFFIAMTADRSDLRGGGVYVISGFKGKAQQGREGVVLGATPSVVTRACSRCLLISWWIRN